MAIGIPPTRESERSGAYAFRGMIEHALPLEPTPHERSENQTDDERAKTEE